MYVKGERARSRVLCWCNCCCRCCCCCFAVVLCLFLVLCSYLSFHCLIAQGHEPEPTEIVTYILSNFTSRTSLSLSLFLCMTLSLTASIVDDNVDVDECPPLYLNARTPEGTMVTIEVGEDDPLAAKLEEMRVLVRHIEKEGLCGCGSFFVSDALDQHLLGYLESDSSTPTLYRLIYFETGTSRMQGECVCDCVCIGMSSQLSLTRPLVLLVSLPLF